MTEIKRKKLKTAALCAAALILISFIGIFVKYRFWWIYGVCTCIGRGETGLLSQVFYETSELEKTSSGDVVSVDALILVNSHHAVPEKSFGIVFPDGKTGISSVAAESFERLTSDCEKIFGKWLTVTSGYRTHDVQAAIFRENPYAVPAGESEHETGLALDVKVDGYAQKRFIMSRVGRWVDKNAYKYGFIVRYPFGKEKITGVEYEPWHLRYVGEPHAEIISRSKITLEEYENLFSEGAFYEFDGYIISYQISDGDEFDFPKNHGVIYVSESNTGKYFIWSKSE